VPGRGLPVPALFIKFRKILVNGEGGWGEFLGFVVFSNMRINYCSCIKVT